MDPLKSMADRILLNKFVTRRGWILIRFTTDNLRANPGFTHARLPAACQRPFRKVPIQRWADY